MDDNNIELALANSKIIPVIVIDDEKKALPLAETLFNSGITCAEVEVVRILAFNASIVNSFGTS